VADTCSQRRQIKSSDGLVARLITQFQLMDALAPAAIGVPFSKNDETGDTMLRSDRLLSTHVSSLLAEYAIRAGASYALPS